MKHLVNARGFEALMSFDERFAAVDNAWRTSSRTGRPKLSEDGVMLFRNTAIEAGIRKTQAIA